MIKFFIKLFISLSIILLLLYGTNIKALQNSFYSISYDAIAYALFLVFLIRFIMALRWKVLLGYYQVHASMMKLLEIIFVSNAVGHLLPSGIGTDIIRTYELSRNKGCSEKILASVFLDRVFGLISMMLVALIAAWYAFFSGQMDASVPLLISLAVMLFPVLYFMIRFLLSKDLCPDTNHRVLKNISNFYNRFLLVLRQTTIPTHGFYVLIMLSVSVQLIRSAIFMLIFTGMGSDIAIVNYFIFIPIVFIIMLIPVSIGGLGVRESALYAFFAPFGLSVATCTVSGLVFHALQLVMIIPGLVIFNIRK